MTVQIATWIVVSGLATGIGGLGIFTLRRRASERMLDVLLGFTAGIMLAATAFSLLVPALDRGTIGEVVGGLFAGAALMVLLDWLVPHAHERFLEHGHDPARRVARDRALLMLSALTIHNIPEGMAVGVAFAAGGPDLGVPLALAIGIQNIPEGFAAGAPLLGAGVPRRTAAGVAAVTGWVEIPAAFTAFAAFELASSLLPVGLGFAAGAMLYVIVDELIPESQSHGFEREASIALLAGFALMLALDNAFG